MLKFLFVGGLLLALVLGYTDQNTAPTTNNTAPSTSSTPWSGMAIGGKTFWADQAKAGTALWRSSLRWCLQEYSNQNQPTVAQGVCTIILSVHADLNGNPGS